MLGSALNNYPAVDTKLWTFVREEWFVVNQYHPSCTVKQVRNCDPFIKDRGGLTWKTLVLAIETVLAPVDLNTADVPFEYFPAVERIVYYAARITKLKHKLDDIIELKNERELKAFSD